MSTIQTNQLEQIQKNANKGVAVAQLCLGELYLTGTGLIKNYEEAFRWFKCAADQGNIKAQVKLSSLFWKGVGTARNPAMSYAWLKIATLTGYKRWHHKLATYWVKKTLTNDELENANRYVLDWQNIEKQDI